MSARRLDRTDQRFVALHRYMDGRFVEIDGRLRGACAGPDFLTSRSWDLLPTQDRGICLLRENAAY